MQLVSYMRECVFRDCKHHRNETECKLEKIEIGKIRMLDLPVCLSMERRDT